LRRNCLLKEKIVRRIRMRGKGEGDASSYWMSLRKRKDTGN
jgi:hypothetical protein